MVPSLLCFDELQVTDVFAAVALKGLLEVLSSEGTVMVMTSNRSPDELNSHGLHEDLFNHFVQSLKAACEPVEVSSGIDYRRLIFSSQSGGGLCLYHSPLGGAAEDGMQRLWRSMVPQGRPRGTPRLPPSYPPPLPLPLCPAQDPHPGHRKPHGAVPAIAPPLFSFLAPPKPPPGPIPPLTPSPPSPAPLFSSAPLLNLLPLPALVTELCP
uniref:Afg1-like atpase family protein n=1 Tax=Tetraselmis sp. GSL018 TaxID=582737 RepID=A0A061QZL7_9CHLO